MKRFEVRVDTACDEVIRCCDDPAREGRWITNDIRLAYLRLHELGWVHSVETWSHEGTLVGGLYGVSIGGLFAGESMFPLAALVEILRVGGATLLDVQWTTSHLTSLGAIDIPRAEYLRRVRDATALAVDPFEALRPA
jgi:leucyl/phenylalanyl-tRNA--protein transferase